MPMVKFVERLDLEEMSLFGSKTHNNIPSAVSTGSSLFMTRRRTSPAESAFLGERVRQGRIKNICPLYNGSK
jgi:hypothetical protein